MNKAVVMLLVSIGLAGFAMAGQVSAAPEIDPSTGISAVALLSGGLLVFFGTRRRK